MRRTVIAAGVGILVVASLGGCSVPARGVLGFQRGDDGSISAIVQMCDGHVDGVMIYSGSGTDEQRLGRWEFESPVTGGGSVPLGQSFESQLKDSVEYETFAWSTDNTSSANGPEITAETLASLQPGQIRTVDHDGDSVGTFALNEFKRMVDRFCDNLWA